MPRGPDQAIAMDTARENPIRNWRDSHVGMPLMSAKIEGDIKPPSVMRASTDPGFNCHGLTFGSRRASILSVEVATILREDGYKRIQDVANILPGDCVIYYSDEGDPEHSGIVVSVPEGPLSEPQIVSKWGPGGPEVLHFLTHVPLAYARGDIRFYRVEP